MSLEGKGEYNIYELPSLFKVTSEHETNLMLEGICSNNSYYFVTQNKKKKTGKNEFITPNQIIPSFSNLSSDNNRIISLSYLENGNNDIPIYILFSSNSTFEESELSNKKFILTQMIRMRLEFIVKYGYFKQAIVNDKPVIVYIVCKDETQFKEELKTLTLDLQNFITKIFLVASYHLRFK